jgi:4-hydroxy-4-methyl-2-oxoglutarate aldolase
MTVELEAREDIRLRYLAVDTSNLADVLDDLGLPDQGLAYDIAPFSGQRLGGWAYTIVGKTVPYDGTGDVKKMEACSGIGPGEVSIWSGDGEGICYFGELIALGMRERGSVGALVDGGVRDLRWLREHEIPVFARYRTPVQSIGRWRVTGWQEPVSIRGATSRFVTVSPGDFILADDDGCIVVPAEHVETVLKTAEQLTRTEVHIRSALRGGLPLEQCLEKFGHV